MTRVKLVFVDDDVDDRDLIREGLLSLVIDHFLVLDSGPALFTYLDKLEDGLYPEAIILDLNMPKMSGLNVLKLLKSMDRFQSIPVYILTTASSSALKQECIQEGAADFFTKPSTLVELYTLLKNINTSVMQ